MQRFFLLFVFIVLFNSIPLQAIPFTVPMLQEWNDNNYSYTLNNTSKIIVNPENYERIISPILTFQKDLKILLDMDIPIEKGDSPKKGDIYFNSINSVDSKLFFGAYFLNIENAISIKAINDTGIFYSTRTLLQLFKQNKTIKGGSSFDYPDYKERGLGVDCGRKYFTAKWHKDNIKELAYNKLNIYHLHFSDHQGFRIQSEKFPEIVSDEALSKAEVKELLKLAKEYYIEIVPEIDMPGHTKAILSKFPEFEIIKADGHSNGPYTIDFTKPNARKFITELLDEFLDLFEGKYFHAGVDEIYLDDSTMPQFRNFAKEIISPEATLQDAVTWFINWVNDIVKKRGKTLRIWNDQLNKYNFENPILTLDKDIIIENWWAPPEISKKILNEGYKVVNIDCGDLYYVLGLGWRPYLDVLYQKWSPTHLSVGYKCTDEESKHILGARVQIWADFPEAVTEQRINRDITLNLRILAQRLWNINNKTFSYSEFLKLTEALDFAPDVVRDVDIPSKNLVLGSKWYTSDTGNNPNNDYKLDYIFDENYISRWISQGDRDSMWIIIELKQIKLINNIKITWHNDFARKYSIYFSSDSLNWNEVFTNNDKYDPGFDNIFLNDSAKYVKFLLYKRANNSTYSICEIELYDSIAISVDSSNNIISDFNVNIYPNPSNNYVIIKHKFINQENPIIELYNLKGEKISTLSQDEKSNGLIYFYWDKLNQPPGTYFIKFKTADFEHFEKIIFAY